MNDVINGMGGAADRMATALERIAAALEVRKQTAEAMPRFAGAYADYEFAGWAEKNGADARMRAAMKSARIRCVDDINEGTICDLRNCGKITQRRLLDWADDMRARGERQQRSM